MKVRNPTAQEYAQSSFYFALVNFSGKGYNQEKEC